jgi:hypothetical protein
LHKQLDEKFDELARLITAQRGDSVDARAEAEEAIEQWEEDAEMADFRIQQTSDLQRLLTEHHEIGEKILDIGDEAVSRGRDD